jgi:hypothetical protein
MGNDAGIGNKLHALSLPVRSDRSSSRFLLGKHIEVHVTPRPALLRCRACFQRTRKKTTIDGERS